MTSQPLSSDRFLMLLALSIGTSTVAQGVGLLVGASANIQVRLCLHIHLCAAIAQVKFTGKKSTSTLESFIGMMDLGMIFKAYKLVIKKVLT